MFSRRVFAEKLSCLFSPENVIENVLRSMWLACQLLIMCKISFL